MLSQRTNRVTVLISVVSIICFVCLTAINPKFIEERLENLTLTYRFQLRNLVSRPPVPSNIVMVLIDEKSLLDFGRWPWKRSLQAQLVRKILEDSPRALAIDIMYPEKEDTKSDTSLAQALAPHRDKVVLAVGFNVPPSLTQNESADPPDYVLDCAIQKIKDIKLGTPIQADTVIPPISAIGTNAKAGHVYSLKDIDGKTVWEISYLKYNEEYYPSFALQAARIALNVPPDGTTLYMGRGVNIGSRMVPIDPFGGRMLINYLGPELTIPHVSASDVLKGRVDLAMFKDKIVFLGTSALATHDIIISPFSANMPGVEKNATVTENIINSRFIVKEYQSFVILTIILTGLLFGLVFSKMRALRASLFSLLTLTAYLFIVQALFTYYGIWLNVIYPVANMSLIFSAITVSKYFFEERKARDIRRIFSSYVSPKIVDEVISHPEKAGLSGQKKVITILFSDIKGFTGISERNTPEQVVALLNEYFHEMAGIIFKWDGTLDKFVGDEIMAFWGAPTDQPDHAERSIRCALDMVARLSILQKKWAAEGREILDAGIGINTGEVIIGNIGAVGKKMDYTAIGDHVNIAARVEKLTRNYNAKIIITDFTLAHIEPLIKNGAIEHVALRFLDTVKVKGKEKPLEIYQITDSEKEKIL